MKEQIDEMEMTPLDVLANDIYQHCPDLKDNYCGDTHCVSCLANALYNAGYRKQRNGEWKYNPDGMDWGLGAWQCSLCGCRNDNLPMDKNIKPMRWAGSKYCPNCGAKMKGGAE